MLLFLRQNAGCCVSIPLGTIRELRVAKSSIVNGKQKYAVTVIAYNPQKEFYIGQDRTLRDANRLFDEYHNHWQLFLTPKPCNKQGAE